MSMLTILKLAFIVFSAHILSGLTVKCRQES
jgi:hypothetical protein